MEQAESLPNLIYTDGNAFSLWRDGELVGRIVRLEGDVATRASAWTRPTRLLPRLRATSSAGAIRPANAKELAEVSARLCRLLRDEVIEQLALGSPALTALAR